MDEQQDQPQDSQNQPQDLPQDQQQEQPLEQPVATGFTAALSLRLPPFFLQHCTVVCPGGSSISYEKHNNWEDEVRIRRGITISRACFRGARHHPAYTKPPAISKTESHAGGVNHCLRTTTPPAAVPNGRTWGSNAIPILSLYAATPWWQGSRHWLQFHPWAFPPAAPK